MMHTELIKEKKAFLLYWHSHHGSSNRKYALVYAENLEEAKKKLMENISDDFEDIYHWPGVFDEPGPGSLTIE